MTAELRRSITPDLRKATQVRKSILVRGRVQGVGFRPFVYELAVTSGLGGHVQNGGPGVYIEVEGPSELIARFEEGLRRKAPPLSDISEISSRDVAVRGDTTFSIRDSLLEAPGAPEIPPDTATCDICLEELFRQEDRRFGHPFITCTSCGPRLSIAEDTPYDRIRTTMRDFPLCSSCAEEYASPQSRRFHAEPIACRSCGPELRVLDSHGVLLARPPIEAARAVLVEGGIVAVRGLGGFHLACDATNERAVSLLRARKLRDAKPFAVMVADKDEAARVGAVTDAEVHELSDRAAPIVLVPRRGETLLAPSVAPGVSTIGLLLPYTPLHHLLLRAVGRPLVMTSGNRSGEPIATTEEEAIQRLGDVVDLILSHDRPIAVPCEDGVRRVVDGVRLPVRRSRGESPAPIALPRELAVKTLAVGGQFKAVFGLGLVARAVLGPHFGDLDDLCSDQAWRRGVVSFERLFRFHPERLVHDLHPDYSSTQYALERAQEEGIALLAVQHHHAHMAACMAEHGLDGDVIGVCFDGVGYGLDGTAWGGEVLVGGYDSFRRAAHLAPMPLLGGDSAAVEPWRAAAAQLWRAGLENAAERWVRAPSAPALRALRALYDGGRSPSTTSVGRLFDATGALILGMKRLSYEGQSGCELESLADRAREDEGYPMEVVDDDRFVIDPAPLFRALVDDLARGTPREALARRVHRGIASTTIEVCARIRQRTGLSRVTLSGGVFCNSVLTKMMVDGLKWMGFEVFRHQKVPPNDGGLALGQLAIAAARGGDA